MPYIRLVLRTIRKYCLLTQSLSFSVCVCQTTAQRSTPPIQIDYSVAVERYGTNGAIRYKHGYLGANQVAQHMLFVTIS